MKEYVQDILDIIGAGCGCSVILLAAAGILMLLVKSIMLLWQLIF